MRVNDVAVEALAQRLDDRNAAADRGLEIERDALAFGERGELLTVAREQRLVGGDHRLAGSERGLHRALGRIAGAADQLDEHVDRRIARQRHRIGEPAKFLQIDVALLAARARADRNDLDGAAAARHKLVAAVLQETHHGACRRFPVRQDRLSAARP